MVEGGGRGTGISIHDCACFQENKHSHTADILKLGGQLSDEQ